MASLRLEAETLNLSVYSKQSNGSASGGQLISNLSGTTPGQATGTFSGQSGTYQVILGYYDENDGKGNLAVSLGGSNNSLLLDKASPSGRAEASTLFTWTVFDSIQLTNGQSFTITGTPEGGEAVRVDYIDFVEVIEEPPTNTAPVAKDDTYSTTVNTPLTIAVDKGVLANDTDEDGDQLTVTLDDAPTDGSIVLNQDGSFTYTPSSSSATTDSFTYTVSDGVDFDTATVTININPGEEPPVEPPAEFRGIVTFDQVVQFEAIVDGQPYRGNIAELSTEIGGINIASIFDEFSYLTQNGDVANAVANGVFNYGFNHFIQFGYKEGRNPSALFDEEFYLSANGDVKAAVDANILGSGLEHFLLFGHLEGRDPSTLFDTDDYLTNNPDVAAAVANKQLGSGFEHYAEFGADEGRLPNLLLFNESYYLANNGDVKAAVDAGAFPSGLSHYLSFGQGEGRNPSSLFDESAYLSANSDVAAAVEAGAFASGLEHYVLFGRNEDRSFAA